MKYTKYSISKNIEAIVTICVFFSDIKSMKLELGHYLERPSLTHLSAESKLAH